MRDEREHGRQWYKKNKKRKLEYQRQWYAKNREHVNIRVKERYKRWREKAILKIASYRIRPKECMIDLTPKASYLSHNHGTVYLIDIPCGGKLEIDHINGGGTKERKNQNILYSFYKKVAEGEYPLEKLRLLCWIHNRFYKGEI